MSRVRIAILAGAPLAQLALAKAAMAAAWTS